MKAIESIATYDHIIGYLTAIDGLDLVMYTTDG